MGWVLQGEIDERPDLPSASIGILVACHNRIWPVLPGISAILYGLPRFIPASMAGEPLASQNCDAAALTNWGSACTE